MLEFTIIFLNAVSNISLYYYYLLIFCFLGRFLRTNLRIDDARGQCYGGVPAMNGANTGVAAQFKSLYGKMLYVHCYGHALNLVVKDSYIKVKCLKKTFEAVGEMSLLVKKSPKRNTNLGEIRNHSKNDAKSIHTFCPTRWAVLGETLESVLQKHAGLLELWEWSLTNVTETEMKGCIIRVNFIMKKFDFCFGCCLGKNVLRQNDILSKSLQSSSLYAAEGQDLATIVIKKLEDRKMSNLRCFEKT